MESITIKIELFNKIANILSQRPWSEVSALMSELTNCINGQRAPETENKNSDKTEDK